MAYIDSETLPVLTCASKTTHDAAVFRDVADDSFSRMPMTEHHVIDFVEKDGYNAYFQNLFASSRHSRVSLLLKWEAWLTKLGEIGTMKGKVPTVITADMLRLLKYCSRAQLGALAKLAGEEEGF